MGTVYDGLGSGGLPNSNQRTGETVLSLDHIVRGMVSNRQQVDQQRLSRRLQIPIAVLLLLGLGVGILLLGVLLNVFGFATVAGVAVATAIFFIVIGGFAVLVFRLLVLLE